MADASRTTPRRQRLTAAAALGGGLTIAAGTLLPWLTLFAGLYPYRGIIGWNGRLMMAGGILCVLGGGVLWVRDRHWIRHGLAALGLSLAVAAAWLLLQQQAMLRALLADQPMTVPGVGPGLFVVAAGALTVCLVPLLTSASAGPRAVPAASAHSTSAAPAAGS